MPGREPEKGMVMKGFVQDIASLTVKYDELPKVLYALISFL
jgi:hypothetical protein